MISQPSCTSSKLTMEHQKNVWNQVNNEERKTISLASFWLIYYELRVDFIYCSGVSIFDFEQVMSADIKLSNHLHIFSKISLTGFRNNMARNFPKCSSCNFSVFRTRCSRQNFWLNSNVNCFILHLCQENMLLSLKIICFS